MRSILFAVLFALGSGAAVAQGLTGMEKQVLPMTKASWIAFRNYDGRQLIYFTHLVAYRCGLSEIRYSLDSTALDQRFEMPSCDPQRPNEIPADFAPYLTLPLGSARMVSIQPIYADGEVAETVRFAPCDIADDGTCARLLE
jgi:hypothetical protein